MYIQKINGAYIAMMRINEENWKHGYTAYGKTYAEAIENVMDKYYQDIIPF